MDLDGAGGYFRWTNLGWSGVLALAEHYGWEPTGTGPPRGILKAEWPGYYYSNDGALFYARDAKALADSLDRALDLLPARRPKALKHIEGYDYFVSQEGKRALREFITYCRAGSFRLY
jgi:hypothetical protein